MFDDKAYAPVAEGPRRVLKPVFENTRGPRRLVLASKAWPPQPRYRTPAGSRGGHSRDDVVARYLSWAKDAGLSSVTFYRGDYRADGAAQFGLDVRYVDSAEFLGAAPVAETVGGDDAWLD